MKTLVIDGNNLVSEQIQSAAKGNVKIVVHPDQLEKVASLRRRFEDAVKRGLPIYGVTTGYGEMVHRIVDFRHEEALQLNLIRSHAAGSGNYFSRQEVRAMMVCRLNALSRGYSAVRVDILKRLCDLLNFDIVPAVPEIGSLGASGDLAPLSHIALVLVGEGLVMSKTGARIPASKALGSVGLKPLGLKFKEGLALINGTSAMGGVAALNLEKARIQILQAEIVTALSLEVLRASEGPFEEKGHNLAKPHPGQIVTASNLRALICGSSLIQTHWALQQEMLEHNSAGGSSTPVFLQKAYTLRCIPQILGAVRDTLSFANQVFFTEINSSNDNPLYFSDDQIFHGGNFHGQHLAFTMDYLGIAMTQVGIVSERRINRLVNERLSNGLPEFLVWKNPGLHCGFAGAQYPATAMVAENRTLCLPASVQSVPSNSDNQDVVSMGLIAGRKTRQIIKNNQTIVGIELLAACHAVDLLGGRDQLGPVGKAVHALVREEIKPLEQDRFMTPDIERSVEILESSRLVELVQNLGIKLE